MHMKDLITAILVKQPKLTAREIAKTLGIEKKENEMLFISKSRYIFSKIRSLCWSLSYNSVQLKKLERPMMNSELELNDIVKNKLIQLLDYVSHQS